MRVVFFVLAVCLCAHTFDSTYPHHITYPPLPCEWTWITSLKYARNNATVTIVNTTAVNGHLIMKTLTENGDLTAKMVVRDDLGSIFPNVWYFNFGSDPKIESDVRPISAFDYAARPYLGIQYFDLHFDEMTRDSWYGVSCTRYSKEKHNNFDYLYVDDNGFPIGAVVRDSQLPHEYNYTFKPSAPLVDFVFDRSFRFANQYIYSPPKSSLCYGYEPASDTSSCPAGKNPTTTTSVIVVAVLAFNALIGLFEAFKGSK